MVPVVRSAPLEASFYSVSDHREQCFLTGIDGITHFHKGDDINARISVPPVNLKTSKIGLNSFVEVPLSQGYIAPLISLAPPIFVYPPKDAVGLTTCTMFGNYAGQHRLGLVASLQTIECKAKLLLYHHCFCYQPRQTRHEFNHSLPSFNRAVGQKQIDQHRRICLCEI